MVDMNARHNEPKQVKVDLHREFDKLTALNRLIRSVTASLNASDVIDAALAEILCVLKPDLAMVFLSEGNDLVLKGSLHAESGALNPEIPPHKVGECLCGLAVSTGEPIYSNDIRNDPRCTWHECKNMGMRSAAALPLKDRGEIFGVLVLASYTSRNFEQEKEFLETLTGQFTAGLKNALLYRQLQLQLEVQKSLMCDREYLEGELTKNEESFRLAMGATSNGLWDWNVETDKGYFSPAYYAMLGYESNEFPMTGAAWLERIHPDDKEGFLQKNRDCMEGKIPGFEAEFRMQSKNGEWRWILGRAKAVVRDNSGRAVRMVGTHTDITDRKKAEEALRESERKYRELVENANSIILRWNPQGEITFLNEFGQKFFGYRENEILGRNVVGTIVPDSESTGRDLRPLMKNIRENPKAYENNINENMLRDGRRVWIAWTNKAVFDAEGTLVEVLSIGTDITNRKRADEILLRNARLLLRAEEVAKFGSWEFVLDENKVNASEGARAIYGLETGELRISDVRKIPLPEYRPMLDRALMDLIEQGIPYNVEFKICRPSDGKIIDIHSIAEYDAAKNVLFGVMQDITERLRTEEERDALKGQLLQAQKMESVARLAGGVAHDFNNMLSAILGHAELAMMRCTPSERIYADLKTIEKAALRSAELIQQLLAFARRQTVAPTVLDLNDRVTGMLKMLQRLIGEDIDLVWMPGTGLWPVKIDPSQIDQLLANLCVNARDAISGVGKVTIETENTTFDEAYCTVHPGFICGEYVMLAVSDNGSGMNKEVLDRLFEPFFTTKEVGKGTGLGLATVHGIVKQNEGFINVYSEPGSGSTFRIYLHRFEGETTEPKSEITAETPKGRGETVLLVEDNAVILNVGKAMLEEMGYKVLTAGTPGDALSQFKAHVAEIQLLITDVIMPEMNGRDLAKLIIEIKPGLKCLFTSGYTANVIAHHGVLDEGLYFLQKPFSMDDLASKVRQALEQK